MIAPSQTVLSGSADGKYSRVADLLMAICFLEEASSVDAYDQEPFDEESAQVVGYLP